METLIKKRRFEDYPPIPSLAIATAPLALNTDPSRPHKKPRTLLNLKHDPAGRKDFVTVFSDELVLHVFEYLSARELNVCAGVSYSWSRIANDRHLWKTLFLSRFPVPRHLSTDHSRSTPPSSRRSSVTQKEIHLSRHRRTVSNGNNVVKFVVEEDWKAMFRVSHNWQTGNCRLSTLSNLSDPVTTTSSQLSTPPPLPLPQNHTQDPTHPPSNPLVQFTRDVILTAVVPSDPTQAPHVRIFHRTGTTYDLVGTMRSSVVEQAIASASAPLRPIAITCLKLDARDLHDDADRSAGEKDRVGRMRRVVAGYSNGGFTVWEFGLDHPVNANSNTALSPSSDDAPSTPRYITHELCTRLPGHLPHLDHTSYYPTLVHHSSSASLVSLSIHSPYLVTCSADFVLSIHHLSETHVRRRSLYTPLGRPSGEAVRTIDVCLAHQLKSFVCWAPVVVEIVAPKASPTEDKSEDEAEEIWEATACYAVPVYGAGWSVGMQEIKFTRSHTHSTRYSSPTLPLLAPPAPFAPIVPATAAPQPSSAPSFAPITTIAYAHPLLVTAHVDNTVQVYRVVDHPAIAPKHGLAPTQQGKLELQHVRTLHGHTSRVESLAVDPKLGRLVSGDRAEIKVWDLEVWDEEAKGGKIGRKIAQLPMDPAALEARRRSARGEWMVSLGERAGETAEAMEFDGEGAERVGGWGVKWIGFDEGRIVSVSGGRGGAREESMGWREGGVSADGSGVGIVKVWSFCDV